MRVRLRDNSHQCELSAIEYNKLIKIPKNTIRILLPEELEIAITGQ
jgi:hypothetical protein